MSSLESAIQDLKWQAPKTEWAAYYQSTVTGGRYVEHKKQIVAGFLNMVQPQAVWDLGANTGLFSRLAAGSGASVLSFDADPACVEINYLEARRGRETRLLPLLMDLANPSPALGWDHRERMSWLERPKPDMVLALGLAHHLAIANNLPLDRIADFCARLGPWLAVEFVPKDDPNARKLLHAREDIFDNYSRQDFERAFCRRFTIEDGRTVQDSARQLYLMRLRPS
jgi:ribosomal protein L11 methylase PrmA